MTEVLRPLTLGELLDRTISLYRRNLLVFSGLIAVPSLLGVAGSITATLMLGNGPPDLSRILSLFGAFLIVMLVSLIANAIAQAATMIAVSRIHLGQPATIGDSFAAVRGRLIRIVLITIALGLMTAFGFFLLIIPGIFLALRWSLAIPSAVLEDLGLRRAMGRSAALVEGQYGRIFMVFVLYFLLVLVMSAAFQTPVTIINVMQGGSLTLPPLWVRLANAVAGFFVQVLVAPLLTIAIALSYYDARVRKEAFDLQHMLTQLDAGDRQPAMMP
jgi:hypothetical protein